MKALIIDCRKLRQWLDEKRDLLLIDVSPADCFEAGHLPDAHNACVYEVTFVGQVNKMAPSRDQTIVLYGSSAKNLASSVAAEKLARSGFRHVYDYGDGLDGWRLAGFPVVGTKAPKCEPTPEDRTYLVDTDKSIVEWTGRNIGGKHVGTLKFSSGKIVVAHESLTHGSFEIDMRTIRNDDIHEQSMASLLVQHLMSDDFFEVDAYPSASFVITKTEAISDSSSGMPDFHLQGQMTIKGIKREIDFPAVVGFKDGEIIAQAHFDIDRTQWNVIYGSGRFFEHLGMHLVNDIISLQLKIVAR